MDADPQCNMTEMLLCDVIERLDEEAERTGGVAELPGTSLLQVLEPRFNGDESFVNIDRIESVQIDTNLWLLRGDVSLNRLEDYIAEAHTQRFSNKIHERRNYVALGDMLLRYPQCTRGQTVRMAEFAVLLRYFQSAYVQYASFKCLAGLQIQLLLTLRPLP